MKVIVFYPISNKQSHLISQFTFESGGLVIKKDGELFYNEFPFSMELDSNNSVIRHVEYYRFKNQKGQSINVTPASLNEMKSNLKEVVANYMKESGNKMSEKELIEFEKELDSFRKYNLIDYALSSNNKELFLKLTGEQQQTI